MVVDWFVLLIEGAWLKVIIYVINSLKYSVEKRREEKGFLLCWKNKWHQYKCSLHYLRKENDFFLLLNFDNFLFSVIILAVIF